MYRLVLATIFLIIKISQPLFITDKYLNVKYPSCNIDNQAQSQRF